MSLYVPSQKAIEAQKERDQFRTDEVTMLTGFTPSFFKRYKKKFSQYWEELVVNYPYIEQYSAQILQDDMALYSLRNIIMPYPLLEADRSAYTQKELNERYRDAEMVYVNNALTLLCMVLSPQAASQLLDQSFSSVLVGMSFPVGYSLEPTEQSPFYQLYQARTVVSVIATVALDTYPEHPIKGTMALLNELNLSEDFLALLLPLIMDEVIESIPVTH